MTITMLNVFVPGALWGFVAMPWYGWIALGGVCLGGLLYVKRGSREGRRRGRRVRMLARSAGWVLHERRVSASRRDVRRLALRRDCGGRVLSCGSRPVAIQDDGDCLPVS
jgi:hypothetical protein